MVRIGWGLCLREREREREREETSVKHARRPRSLNQVALALLRSVTAAAPLIVNVKPDPRKIGHSLFQDRLEFLVSYKWQHIAVQ